jgi:peptide/nickel transport system substrate-binding protein
VREDGERGARDEQGGERTAVKRTTHDGCRYLWKGLALASVGAACVGFAGCTPGRDRGAPDEGPTRAIELSVPLDIETLDPRFAGDWISMRASRLVHAGLVRLDPDTLEPLPYAAKSWTWLDARTLRVELRDDVYFHGGAKLTSRDVTATLAAVASPLVASRHLRLVDAIASATEDGPNAVIVRLSRAHATLVTDLELPILRADQAFAPPDPDGALDGLGPFAVARATRGDVLLVPADHGVLPRPSRSVAIRTVHDDNARALRLIAGRSDVAINVLSLLPVMEHREELHVVTRPGANLSYIMSRLDRGPLEDVRVRRALSLAIDRAGLAASLFEGHVSVASTLIPPHHWAHTDAPRPPRFDIAEARSTLAAALAERGPSRRLHLTLLTSTDRFRGTVARAIAQEAREAGFDLEVIPLELGTMLARMNAGDFEMAILGFPELTEPNVLRNLLHTEFMPPVGYNRARLHDPELDALLDLGDRVPSQEERRAAYAKVEARVRDQVLLIPLWNEDQLAVVSARARGFIPSAEGRWLSLAALP